ncbi:MAG: choice-of-anchor I domain-containing protein [Synechococcus sp.]
MITGSKSLAVVDMSDPSAPLKLTDFQLDGSAQSVDVYGDLVAVAIAGANKATEKGFVQFLRITGEGASATLANAGQLTVGYLPDSLKFNADGTKLVVANEGEPNIEFNAQGQGVDPSGTIGVITINQADPQSSSYKELGFDAAKTEYWRSRGVRISTGDASTDIEPEFVAIEGDKAYVTLQENNAVAVVDISGEGVLDDVRSLGVKDWYRGQVTEVQNVPFSINYPGQDSPVAPASIIDANYPNDQIVAGGLSGLFWSDDTNLFYTITDRGPQAQDIPAGMPNAGEKVFNDPDYPITVYALEEKSGGLNVSKVITLKVPAFNADGTRKAGSDAWRTSTGIGQLAAKDDAAFTPDGNGGYRTVANDAFGLDTESIIYIKSINGVNDGKPVLAVSDEYRPQVALFDAESGNLVQRFVPEGTDALYAANGYENGRSYDADRSFTKYTLPEVYGDRRGNRGFEGMAWDGTSLYAFIQSPMRPAGYKNSTVRRILKINPLHGVAEAEYLYVQHGASDQDKIGDAVYDAQRDVFYVIDRDSGTATNSNKSILELDLRNATNVLGMDWLGTIGVDQPEGLDAPALTDALASASIMPVQQVELLNLPSVGVDPRFDKPEGLALKNGQFVVGFDNDFLKSGTRPDNHLAYISYTATPVDTSDKDGAVNPSQKDFYGLRMPDAIATFVIDGETYTATANEGDGRVRPDAVNFEATADGTYSYGTNQVNGFVQAIEDAITGNILYIYADATTGNGNQFDAETGDEFFISMQYCAIADDDFYSDEKRAGKLDNPSSNVIVSVDGEGRLKTIQDLNSKEVLYGFGGRGFSIFDSKGNLVFDSGSLTEELAVELGVYNDKRSDDKGTEVEGITTGVINGRTYAFVGLERAQSSTILQFDISNPAKSVFVQALQNPNSISAEGLQVITIDGVAYLQASNEVTGHLDTYRIENKTIGSTTALIPEAGSAVKPEWLLDGQSGNTNFPYGTFKALATVGEIDARTGVALTGYPDGNAAWLLDDDTVRVAYQSESYATISTETYGQKMASGVTFTGSKVHTIDYSRAGFSGFLSSSKSGADIFEDSGFLFDTVYNVFGEVVDARNDDKSDLSAKWGNQVKADGTLVEFKDSKKLKEADFFFHSFCGAWYEQAQKFGAGIGFADDVWLMAEEWNIGSLMFDDPDGAGAKTGVDVANDTMGLASMVVDIANETAYVAPALGQTGYEKIMGIQSGSQDHVVLVMAGYNHGQEPAPNRIYVGVKDKQADGSDIDYATASQRDAFLARNGLLYGKIYGLALDAATYSDLGITVDPTAKMVDSYMKDAAAPSTFKGKFFSTSYQWDGFDSPEAVGETEMMLWEKASEQPAGYTFFNGDTKAEHPAVDPDITKSRYIQNMTDEGGILGFDFGVLGAQLKAGELPTSLDVDVTRIVAAVDGSLTLKTNGEGLAHQGDANPYGTLTAATHVEKGVSKMVAPDGLLWVKNADGDFLIVDEDSGNDYGERKYAIALNSDDMTLRDEATGFLLGIGGGPLNPRALASASALGGAATKPYTSEFSGSWNVTHLVAQKSDGTFYTKDELTGTQAQDIIGGLGQMDQKYIGVIQQRGESGGQVEATKSDRGGQLFMFDMKLPALNAVDSKQGADKPFLLDLDSQQMWVTDKDATMAAQVTVSRSAAYQSNVGFYKVVNEAGDVIVGGQTYRVGDADYAAAALDSSNLVGKATLSRDNGQSNDEQLIFDNLAGGGFVAMYGTVANTGRTYFSYAAANSDGYNHFKFLSSNKVGFEDIEGGGDRDHNDLIVDLTSFG